MADGPGFFNSLRFKFAFVLAVFSGILALGMMFLLEQDIRTSLIRENIDKGIGIARGVAFNTEDPLLTGDDIALFSALKNALRSPGIQYAVIVDTQGQVRAADDVTRVGKPFVPFAGNDIIEKSGEYQVSRHYLGGEAILDLEVPMVTVGEPPLRLATIHLGLSEELIARQITAMRNRMGLVALVGFILGGVAAFVLAGIAVRPVHVLVAAVRAVGAGNLEQHVIPRRNDEIGILTTAFNDMTVSLREKEYIKNTFERYVSKPLAEQILKHKNELQLGGEEREVTVLFCDIRRFTALAETLPPTEVVQLLNDYFTRMIEIVSAHQGMVDKLMGDSVMALFGAPLSLGDEPLQAIRCALAMQRSVESFNEERRRLGQPPLQMGIGINTGLVVAGNIGSSMRMEYTVIGDNVNIAARLQGMAQQGEVLVSEATYAKVGDKVEASRLETIAMKGKSRQIEVFRIDRLRQS
ncbi:MAG: hypothetical protein A2091_00660 [Desulfuromonadales bacterium GWD2_61_12]|nr:MAG: hypothetical protein A2091_00660 [Desulfuromonadales bacterium GWD2_61_12]OGR34017.1 MAG: hypothetical protein A2005_03160 [Desulfuromonadales bacterium GWC2_61_20]HAD05440.1 hypothetical protein [Desulfuromonas sp.]HBT81934.1 hypothetical protein [Desulfuromonas sp.]